jgi:hypothetical protein
MKRNEKTLQLIKEHNLNGDIVEVGVLRGAFSNVLIKSNPKSLTLIDCWQTLSTDEFPDYVDYTQEKWDSIRHKVEKRFLKHKNVNIIKAKSMQAVTKFADNSLDFVYLDGNHTYDFVKQDLNAWYNKVKVGGILAGHDYPLKSVKQAVDEFCKDKKLLSITEEKLTASYYIKKNQYEIL